MIVSTGCGSKLSNSALSTTSWSTSCSKSATENVVMSFGDSILNITHKVYAKPGCVDEVSSVNQKFEYQIGAEVGEVSPSQLSGTSKEKYPVKALDLTLKALEVSYKKPAGKTKSGLDEFPGSVFLGRTPENYNSRDVEILIESLNSNCYAIEVAAGKTVDLLTRTEIVNTPESFEKCPIAFGVGMKVIGSTSLIGGGKTTPFRGYENGDEKKPIRLMSGTKFYGGITLIDQANLPEVLRLSEEFSPEEKDRNVDFASEKFYKSKK